MRMAEKKLIQSISRAVRILDYIAENDNVRLVDISNNLELHKSTLYGIITTLQEENFLTKDYNNTYSLGTRLYELGKIYEKKFSIKKFAKPYLEKISSKFKETVHLAIEANFQLVYIDIIQSTYTIGITSNSENKKALNCTAVGKIFLANMEEKRLKQFFKSSKLIKYTANTITDEMKLKNQFDIIKKIGYSYEIEETEMGLACVAAAIKQFDGKVIASITVSAPVNRMTDEKIEQIGHELALVCSEISQNIG